MSGAIYNEIDAYAAQWTRNLIAAGHVAPGVVDERSIVDLAPADVAGPGQRHFFAGIAGWSYALRLAGVPDDVNVWTGSAPCQGLSDAGRKLGFADPRHLWPAWFRLIDAVRPRVVLGEQVASRFGLEWLDLVCADLEGAGYTVRAADTCAASVGAPHIRQRIYFVAYADGVEGRLLVPRGEPRREDAQAGRSGEAVGLSHAECHGRQDDFGAGPAPRTTRRSGDLADASGELRIEGIDERQGQGDWSRPADDRGAHRLGDPGSVERRTRLVWQSLGPDDGGTTRGVGNADGRSSELGLHGNAAEDFGRKPTGTSGERDAPSSALDPWRGAAWLPCSDGKSRPVESLPLEMADGLSAVLGSVRAEEVGGTPGRMITHPLVATGRRSNRAARLRGTGNAIVAQQAAAFIRAALMESA